MRQMPMIFGLTGGIASGKSTVTAQLRELGACVIDADVNARRVVAPGEPALEAIREAFGDGVIGPDGALVREALGAIIFADPQARARLNAITHPHIAQLMWRDAMEAREQGHLWVVYDAALIVENNLQGLFAGLIVVAVSREVQLERLMQRDHLTLEQAEARLAAQLPMQDKVAVADHVIDNSGTRDATRAQVEALYATLKQRAEQEAASQG